MVLQKVKERSGRVKRRVLHTLSSGDLFTGRVVVGAVALALVVVMIWGFLHYHVGSISFPVPSPMYVFLITRIFFVCLLVFIMGSMIWSCIESHSQEKRRSSSAGLSANKRS